jgi:hypothetical protein
MVHKNSDLKEKARELRRLCDDVLNAQHQCQVEMKSKKEACLK